MQSQALKKFIFYGFPFFTWAFIIYYLSSKPAYFFSKTSIPFSDKIIHIFEYSVFSILLLRLFRAYTKIFSINFIFFIVIYSAIIFGMTDELHQAFVVGRDAAIPDLCADIVGSILGIVLSKRRMREDPPMG